MQISPSSHDLLAHVRIVFSMIVSLGVARLLNGVAGIIQQPKRENLCWLHLCWVAYMLLSVTAFWWWEFSLSYVTLNFEAYIFLVGYTALQFMLCSLLFPTHPEGQYFREYFMARRAWFFGLLAVSLIVDIADTWLKGTDYLARLSPEYFVRIGLMTVGCVIACLTRSIRYHAVFGVIALGYLATYLLRHYSSAALQP